jgi:hypothetical protein
MPPIQSASANDVGFTVPSIYWRRDQSGLSGFSHGSDFPVVLTLWSLWLSGHSGYSPVILAILRSFWLFSGYSGHKKTKEVKKGEG